MSDKTDIIVFGATGFTGRLITEYLATHPQKALFSLGVAARSESKLRGVLQELGLGESGIRTVTLDVTDPDSVERAVKAARVVVNTVGPYWRWGTPVVRSCVRNNVHYVDLTGEGCWIHELITQFDWLATKNHTVIIPSCGYDSIPSDISAHLAVKTLHEHVAANHPDILASVGHVGLSTSISAHRLKTGISGGTLASFITAIEEVPPELRKISGNPFFISPIKGTPLPFPKLVYSLPIPGGNPIVGSFFVMRPSNAAIVHRTAGLIELQARTARSKLHQDPKLEIQRYGTSFAYDEFLAGPSKFSAFFSSISLIFGLLLVRLFKPLRRLILQKMPSGSGPSIDQKETGYLHLTNISTSADIPSLPPVKVKTDVKIKGDPGYYKTAVMISESALSLLLPPPSAPSHVKENYNPFDALPSMAREGGILTPMTALGDVLIQRLRDTGSFEFSSSVVQDPEDRKRI
ncbi:saccharopine dehydrogenase [Coprinopsis cinerea okayama7|uniref:Saccharopine dehydrogenase n=1 Tax=Coprinopsis cinerea (strain Okayama-7 / 130 / ATCC MYA-4618 / FGSC 9003) TaxID=240176 RepID=A8N5D2_COPC7|nr:saccharopine dehydrogenase [Coprinopsis cinerea okayama7\|eukprot:XP_001830077.1 saccharopine dehydrogenase [Coprinopsis cinerea okayama7\